MMGTTNVMKQSIFPSRASGGKHSSEHTDRTQTGNKNLDLHPSSAPHQLLNLNLASYTGDYSMFGNNKRFEHFAQYVCHVGKTKEHPVKRLGLKIRLLYAMNGAFSITLCCHGNTVVSLQTTKAFNIYYLTLVPRHISVKSIQLWVSFC